MDGTNIHNFAFYVKQPIRSLYWLFISCGGLISMISMAHNAVSVEEKCKVCKVFVER